MLFLTRVIYRGLGIRIIVHEIHTKDSVDESLCRTINYVVKGRYNFI